MSKYAQVQKQQKQLPFTVTPIGDETALKFWRQAQIVKAQTRDFALQVTRQDARSRSIRMIEDQHVNPFKLSESDKAELTYRQKRLARARAAKAQAEATVSAEEATAPASDSQSAPVGVIARIKAFFNF